MADEFDIVLHDVDEIDIDASLSDEIEITLSEVDDIEIMVFDYPAEIDLLNNRIADMAMAFDDLVHRIETKIIANIIVDQDVRGVDIEGLNIKDGETVAVQFHSEQYVIPPNTSAYMYIKINGINDAVYSNAATSGGLPNYPYFRITLRERTSLHLLFTLLNGKVLMSGEGMSVGASTAYPYVISGIITPERIFNGGGNGQSDWIDTDLDGIADGWSTSDGSYAQIFSIITGNGFDNRAQRVQANNALGLLGIRQTTMNLTVGSPIILTGKYRSSTPISIYNWGGEEVITLAANLGQALPFSVEFTPTSAYFHFFGQYQVDGWFEIDEVSAIPISAIVSEISSINFSSSGIGSFKRGNNFRVVKL